MDNRVDWGAICLNALGVFVVTLLVYFTIFMAISAQTKRACLRAGWKDNEVTWNLERYCIREENEYEITKPLATIQAGY